MAAKEKREIIFPMGEAFRFSLESIRKRFTRAIITALSIVLGIAFLVVLRIMALFIPIEAYQYWMTIIALLVCGVGIVNSMLMSVTERYKEIGTMKCLGATSGVILEIFLIESALLGLLGGVIGSAIGLSAGIITYGLQPGFGWTQVFNAELAVAYVYNFGLAIAAALLLSVVAAMYPALYAARLDPVAALRYEI